MAGLMTELCPECHRHAEPAEFERGHMPNLIVCGFCGWVLRYADEEEIA